MRWLTFFAAAAVTLTSQVASAQLAAPNAAGVSAGQIHFNVPDPAAVLKAFVDVMGGTEVKSGSLNMVKLPNIYVIATPAATPTPGAQVIHHVGFMVKSFAATKAKAEKAGLAIRELTPGEQAFITFPDDVTVEIQQDPTIATEVAFHHFHINSLNQAADRDWYAKMFGGTDGTRRNAPVALIPGGEADFILVAGGRGGKGKDAAPAAAPTLPPASKGHALDHIGFEVTDLKAFTDKLVANGQKLDMPYTDMTSRLGLKIAFLTDPNGVYIELTEGLSKVK